MDVRKLPLVFIEVWGKVIFLHLFVILFTGGSLVPGVHGPGGAWSGGVPGGAWSWGVHGPGGCLVETLPPRTATAAGGTHPTGMHSCLFIKFLEGSS